MDVDAFIKSLDSKPSSDGFDVDSFVNSLEPQKGIIDSFMEPFHKYGEALDKVEAEAASKSIPDRLKMVPQAMQDAFRGAGDMMFRGMPSLFAGGADAAYTALAKPTIDTLTGGRPATFSNWWNQSLPEASQAFKDTSKAVGEGIGGLYSNDIKQSLERPGGEVLGVPFTAINDALEATEKKLGGGLGAGAFLGGQAALAFLPGKLLHSLKGKSDRAAQNAKDTATMNEFMDQANPPASNPNSLDAQIAAFEQQNNLRPTVNVPPRPPGTDMSQMELPLEQRGQLQFQFEDAPQLGQEYPNNIREAQNFRSPPPDDLAQMSLLPEEGNRPLQQSFAFEGETGDLFANRQPRTPEQMDYEMRARDVNDEMNSENGRMLRYLNEYLSRNRDEATMDAPGSKEPGQANPTVEPMLSPEEERSTLRPRRLNKGTFGQSGGVDTSFMNRRWEQLNAEEDADMKSMMAEMKQNRINDLVQYAKDKIIPDLKKLDPILEKAKALYDSPHGWRSMEDIHWALGRLKEFRDYLEQPTDNPERTLNNARWVHENNFPDIRDTITRFVKDMQDIYDKVDRRSSRDRVLQKDLEPILGNVKKFPKRTGKGSFGQGGAIDLEGMFGGNGDEKTNFFGNRRNAGWIDPMGAKEPLPKGGDHGLEALKTNPQGNDKGISAQMKAIEDRMHNGYVRISYDQIDYRRVLNDAQRKGLLEFLDKTPLNRFAITWSPIDAQMVGKGELTKMLINKTEPKPEAMRYGEEPKKIQFTPAFENLIEKLQKLREAQQNKKGPGTPGSTSSMMGTGQIWDAIKNSTRGKMFNVNDALDTIMGTLESSTTEKDFNKRIRRVELYLGDQGYKIVDMAKDIWANKDELLKNYHDMPARGPDTTPSAITGGDQFRPVKRMYKDMGDKPLLEKHDIWSDAMSEFLTTESRKLWTKTKELGQVARRAFGGKDIAEVHEHHHIMESDQIVDPYRKAPLSTKSRIMNMIQQLQTVKGQAYLESRALYHADDALMDSLKFSDKDKAAYKALTDFLDYQWEAEQATMKKLGLPDLPRMRGYMPHYWKGAYVVYLRDGKALVHKRAFTLRSEAEGYIKEVEKVLDKKYGGLEKSPLQFEIDPKDPSKNQKFSVLTENLSNYGFFYDQRRTLEMMDNQPGFKRYKNLLAHAELRALQMNITEAYERNAKLTGFVGGDDPFVPKSETTRAKEAEALMDMWNRYSRHIAAQRKVADILVDTWHPLMVDHYKMIDKVPEFRKWAQDFLRIAMEHYNRNTVMDRFLRDASVKFGATPTAGATFLKFFGKWISYVKVRFIGNARFLAASVMQPMEIFKSLMQAATKERVQGGEFGPAAVMKATINGLTEWVTHEGRNGMHKLGIETRDPDIQRALDLYTKEGHKDKFSSRHVESFTPDTGFETARQTLGMSLIHNHLESRGRGTAFSAMFAYQKALGKSFKDAYSAAVTYADTAMVNYTNSSVPQYLVDHGIASEMFRTFAPIRAQYFGTALNNLTLLHEAIEQAPTKGRAATNLAIAGANVAAFIGLSVALAGVSGLIGVAEWEQLVKHHNEMPVFKDDPWEMPQAFLKRRIPDDSIFNPLFYGPLSYLMGWDITPSMAAPTLQQATISPGFSTAVDALAAGFHGAKAVGSQFGLTTPPSGADIMNDAKSLLPPIMNAQVENYIAKKYGFNGDYKDSIRGDKSGGIDLVHRRTQEESDMYNWTGARSISETNKIANVNTNKIEGTERSEQRKVLINKLVDAYSSGASQSVINTITTKLAETGEIPTKSTIDQLVKQRKIEYFVREMNRIGQGQMSVEKAKELERIKQLGVKVGPYD